MGDIQYQVVVVGALTEINVSDQRHSPSAEPNFDTSRKRILQRANLQEDTMSSGMVI